MITAEHIAAFWEEVHTHMCERHQLEPGVAWSMINRFRATLESRQIGNIVFHEDPRRLAKGIATGWAGALHAAELR